jgi:hypothetical protein
MRKVLTLTCCLGLASLLGAAQNNDQNNNNQQYKKKGNAQQQQVVAPQTGGGGKKYYKSGQGAGAQNFQQPNTVGNYKGGNKAYKKQSQGPVTGQNQTGGGNMNSNAANTKFNKSFNKQKFGQGNVATGGGGKYQKKHFNLQTNQINTKYKTVNFNQNYHIAGAQHWKGAKYQVFVNYHPVWHDQWWWQNHYHNNIVFVFGGWYFWNAGYWSPAWGYAPESVYYYDGPIYASSPTEDPGQVVANVQSALQEQGYYQGDIDGILGPETRAALAEYQSAQGLEPTGAVDEPTLETLGMV